MGSDTDILSEIDAAFGGCPKPEHFGDYAHCEECAEHDEVLRDRSRATLAIEDVGNVGWDPVAFSNAAGIAHYFPTLARLAMSPPTYKYGWYGDLLLIHLTYQNTENRLLRFCDPQQRRAVGHMLRHLEEHFWDTRTSITSNEDFAEARALWNEP